MPTEARTLALRVLGEAERGGPILSDRLAQADVDQLPPRDRALVHELVLGTLRRRGGLDHAIAGAVDRPLARLEPGVLTILRLGAYQLFHMRVPDHAAVAESVELAREMTPRAAGFVNAVLRRLARDGPPPPPEFASRPLDWLTDVGSLPRWLAERWLDRLGPETARARAEALLVVPPAAFRLNPRVRDAADQVAAAGLDAARLAVPGAWQARAGRPADLAARGVLYLQDLGSQMVGQLAAGDALTLDACAAPGGKSTLIADARPDGLVIAAEAVRRRSRKLQDLVRRWGSANVGVVTADALRPPFAGRFDTVLLDAPCTGLGTLGRHPDIRWRARPDDLAQHASRQKALLDSVSALVRPGGRLVYATCSSEPEENEQVVGPFLSTRSDFTPGELPTWSGPFRNGAAVRTVPEREGGDAFTAFVLRRR